ncbi:hypothetical protein LX81_02289 [Palleronia aestuarii]|uniref:OpgC protein n=1 Tax=Palleronia aestuarii TaxID=568105 RepID=A0A2W7NCZ2_9RHOB|nr:OpgC domain-containing protein [Palleronia aestuarii]PZX16017.1 hypothetical protein LX81_02289 [Palleronia aestuarii]
MGRLYIIDGFRGFFLLFMGIVHFNGILGTTIGRYNHHVVGWVEDAQGFVFISGMVVGLVYGKKFLRSDDPSTATRAIWARIRTIYSHHAGLIFIFLASALLLGAAVPNVLAPYAREPIVFTMTSLVFTSSSMHMGILPMYIGFMVFVPLAFRWLHEGKDPAFWALVGVCWLAAQTALAGFLMNLAQNGLRVAGVPVTFGIYFNLLGWQVLFFVGLFFGFRMAQGRLDLSVLSAPGYRLAFLIAGTGIILLAIYKLSLGNGVFPADFFTRDLVRNLNERSTLSTIYVAAFALDAFVIVWLLNAGVTDRAAWVRGLSGAIRWLFSRPALVFLGQHSLHVFSFHLLVFYAMGILVEHTDMTEFVRSLVLVAATASLWLAAWAHARMQSRGAVSQEPRAGSRTVPAKAATTTKR